MFLLQIIQQLQSSATSGPSPDPEAAATAMVRLSPQASRDPEAIAAALKQQGIDCKQFTVLKRSLDARRRPAVVELIVGVEVEELSFVKGEWKNVAGAQPPSHVTCSRHRQRHNGNRHHRWALVQFCAGRQQKKKPL